MRPTDRQMTDWMLATCRMYGASEATTLRCAALFIEGIHAHWEILDNSRKEVETG